MLDLNYITDKNINPLVITETKPIHIKGMSETNDKKQATIKIDDDNDITVFNKLIVKLSDESKLEELESNLEGLEVIKQDPVAGMYVYEVETATTAIKLAAELEILDCVEFATVEKSVKESALLAGTRNIPTDLDEVSTSPLGNTHTNWSLRPEYLNMQEVWKYVKGDGVIVGISDEGVQKTHPDLEKNYLTGWEITSGSLTNNGGEPTSSSAAHGTNVAGMAAADAGNGKAIGTAPEAYIKSFNFFTTQTDLQIAMHYDKLRNDGCEVINCSWGTPVYFRPGKEGYVPHITVTTALNMLEANNVLVVRVSGNSGGVGYLRTDQYTNTFGPYNQIDHGISENLFESHSIVVGSVTDKDSTKLDMVTRSDFSSTGDYVDIAAYGGNYIDPTIAETFTSHITGGAISSEMQSMLLDGSTPFGVSSTDFTSTGGYQVGDFSEVTLTGTSFAAPQLAGIIAVLKSANPSLTNDEVKDCLYSTADKINNKLWKPYGFIPSQVTSGLLDSNDLPYKQVTTLGAYKAANPSYKLPNIDASTPVFVFASTDGGMISTMFRVDLYYVDSDPNKNLTDKKFGMGYGKMPNNDYVYFGIDVYGLENPNYTNRADGYSKDNAYGTGVVNPIEAVKKSLGKDFKLTLNNNDENYYMLANPGYSSTQFKTMLDSNVNIEKVWKADNTESSAGINVGDGCFVKTKGDCIITFPGQTVTNIGDVIVDKRNDVSVGEWHLLGACSNIRVDNQTQQTYYVNRNNVWYSYPQVTTNGKVKTRPLHVIYKGEAYWYKKDTQNPQN